MTTTKIQKNKPTATESVDVGWNGMLCPLMSDQSLLLKHHQFVIYITINIDNNIKNLRLSEQMQKHCSHCKTIW